MMTTAPPAAPATETAAGASGHASSPGVRRVTIDANGVTLSALLSEPAQSPPRAMVVALHGGGMTAGYFDGQAHPAVSLLTLGASLGFTVLAIDRPGYGSSAERLPEGQSLVEQARTVRAALGTFTASHPSGAGIFLLAHSYGGKLAVTFAAGPDPDRDPDGGRDPRGTPNEVQQGDCPALLGLDISGCGHRYAVGPGRLPGRHGHGGVRLNWGRLSLYPPDTFRTSAGVVAPVPLKEGEEAARWERTFPDLATRVRVPVRLTFAEHEAWWRHDDDTLADLTGLLSASPRVLVDRLPGAGHNISLGWVARTYHLRALAFVEECLAARETAAPAH